MARLTITASSFCVLLSTILPLQAFAANAIEDKGRLEAVTVYRGQALVTRVLTIPGEAGLREVVVTDLPEQVVPGSLYAESSDGIEVRSVIFRQKPVAQDVREEVRAIDVKIREVQDQIWTNTQSLTLLASRSALLDKLEQFTAPTANVELTKGVLDPAALKEITSYLIEQRAAASQADLQLQMEKRDMEERLAVLQRERQELAGVPAQTAREAVVFVNVARPGGELRLRYLVNQATWSPSYTVRAGDDRSAVNVEYHASIQQLSGEDWADVAMTLSTATPSLVAKAPALDPLRISLTSIAEQAAAQYGQREFVEKRAEIQQQQVMENINRAQFAAQGKSGAQQPNQTAGIDWNLNDLACKLQVLELASQGDIRAPEQHNRNIDAGLSVTYQLPGRTGLPSRSDRQLIQIASLPMTAEFYKVAIPVLSDSVFEEAKLTNGSAFVLLAGPVSTYLAGQFVGHGDMPTVSAGQDLTLGFGIDSSLRVARELVNKTESIQGGNRVVDLNYELVLENFGGKAAKVRILDRKPIAEGSQVKLTLVSSAPEQASAGADEKVNGKNGILRWDVEAPARTNGPATSTVAYHLRMEYDKQMSITGLAMNQ